MRYVANAIIVLFIVLFLALPLGVEVHAQTSAASVVVIEQPWARDARRGEDGGSVHDAEE